MTAEGTNPKTPQASRAAGATVEKNLRHHLRSLCSQVGQFLVLLDGEMKLPHTEERGRRIARLANDLDMARQIAKRYGLGEWLHRASRKPRAAPSKDSQEDPQP